MATHPMGEQMTEIADQQAIHRLMTRYALACDEGDIEALRDVFTADARASYSGTELPAGIEHILAHVAPLAGLPAAQHLVGTVLAEVDGDWARATSYTVARLVTAVEGGHRIAHRGLRYDDELVRTPEGWRIGRRLHRVLWATSEPTEWPPAGHRPLERRAG